MNKKKDLLDIIRNKRVYPVFQPIISLCDGEILGYEALSRIDGESKIDNIEELFVLSALYDKTWEIERICRRRILEEYANFPEENTTGRLFMNVNPLVMRDNKFKKHYTKKQLEKRGMNAEKIVIEVTERDTIDNLDEFRDTVNHYKKEGYRIAIDDVGSCYSGLNVIANTSPQFIKIDMALVRDIDKEVMKQAIVKGLVEMANIASFEVVAEGIETEEELSVLRILGVNYGQGYLFQKPQRELIGDGQYPWKKYFEYNYK